MNAKSLLYGCRYILMMISVVVSIGILIVSCGDKDNKNAGNEQADLIRLDKIVAGVDMSPGIRDSLLIANYGPTADYLYMMGLGNDDIRRSADTLSASASYKVFGPDVKLRFDPNEIDVERVLGRVNKKLNENSIIDYIPKYYAVISPYRQAIMLTDSAVYVAVNHYLGSNYEGYAGMPSYALNVKNINNIGYDVAEALIDSSLGNKSFSDVSQRLLYEGALTYIILDATSGSVSEMLGWNDEQFTFVNDHISDIWNTLASHGLLYSTSEADADRLFAPSPATTIISADLPGRVGRYLGLKVVESYLDRHPVAKMMELLSPEFYANPRTIIESGYVPGR